MNGIPIRVLRPKWLEENGRTRLGVELDCPHHPDEHRVCLWFANPPDGGPPASASADLHDSWLAECDDLEHLTVLSRGPNPHRPITIGHFVGWLVEGEIAEARIVGVAW